MNALELEMQISATRAFILADAEDLTLLRRTRSSDGAGGYTYDAGVPLAPQTARLIPQQDQTLEVQGSDGRFANPQWILLMEPGSDIQRYDQFEWNDNTWEIAQLHMKPSYELKGDVILVK